MSTNIVAHFNPDGIPDYLKQRPQWIVWGKRTRQSQNALLKNGKLDRTPFTPRTGEVALSDDPLSWETFKDAIDAYQSGWYNGIGFMIAENDGLVGITLNHCFLIGTKILLPEAEQILARFDTTFAEIFPSGNKRGDGLHIYCFGLASRCGKGEHAQWIELYGKDITGRRANGYLCVTGHQFSKTRDITNCQASLSWLHQIFKVSAIPAITIYSVPAAPIGKDIASRLEKTAAEAIPATRVITSEIPATPISTDNASRPEKNASETIPATRTITSEVPATPISTDNASSPEKNASEAFDEEVLKVQSASDGSRTRAEPKTTLKHIATPAKTTVGAAAVVSPDDKFRQHTFPFTDLGNTERFVHLYGDQLRYCYQNKSWYIWDGRRWERDQKMRAMEFVHETVRRILNDAVNTRLSKEQANLATLHALKSENSPRMKAILEHARPKLSIAQAELDAHPMLLNVKNGVVDLKTGQLLPHNPKLLLSQIANTPFVKTATCPRWLAFVDWCFNSDQYLIDFVQKGIGYSIAGEIREQNFFVLYGDSDNGKSTFINVIRLLLGDYGYAAPHTLIIKQRHEGHPTELAALKGRRVVAVSETNKYAPLNIRRMKDLTNRTMTARFMGGNFFEFSQSHTIWIDTNHRPVINDPNDAGIWKRVKPIPFLNKIAKKDRDINLEDKLLAEAPGILSWLVEGCVAYQRKGLAEPPIVVKAKRDYKGEHDVIGAFLEDCCNLDNPKAIVSTSSLFKAYQDWCVNNNEHSISNRVFGREIKARGFGSKKSNGVRQYVGIELTVNQGR
jgi:putative DNA primase/helicase